MKQKLTLSKHAQKLALTDQVNMFKDGGNERSSADSLFRKGNAYLYPFHFEVVPGSATGNNTGSAAGSSTRKCNQK